MDCYTVDAPAGGAMRIAVDCDDVVFEFWPRVVKCHNKEFGTDYTPESQGGWENNPIKTSPFFGEGKMYSDWWEWWQANASLWATCDAYDGALGGLRALHEQGHYVELVTSKPSWARRDFFDQLHKWRPYFDSLIIIDELDPNKPSKADVSTADILIDDREGNCTAWAESGRHALLYDQPWNQEVNPKLYGHRIQRVKNWDDILQKITEIAPALPAEVLSG